MTLHRNTPSLTTRRRLVWAITGISIFRYLLNKLDYPVVAVGKINAPLNIERIGHLSRDAGIERLRSKGKYLSLPLRDTNRTLAPITAQGRTAGIGHRLYHNIIVFIYGISRSRLVFVHWEEVSWAVVFNDTYYVKAQLGEDAEERYLNSLPDGWLDSIPPWPKGVMPRDGTSFDEYNRHDAAPYATTLIDMPLGHSVVKLLHDSIAPAVLSFLSPIREESYLSELHLCVHIREGNKEPGVWSSRTWRHIHLSSILLQTLHSMVSFANKKNATNVSVFIASDSPKARPWFQNYAPPSWKIIRTGKEMAKPESGVWFGGDGPNAKLTQETKDNVMAEAISDVFALGECDALFIPSYSSFSLVSIMMMRAERRSVLFMDKKTGEYVELSYPDDIKSG
ncbi:hypothetical protein HJC23_009307 [Cyclotella cryptica]|uniref:Uncharacterized protein n=1 Tax=Cyclotella cryptica TaxID=29204 RepID=A0ABD3QS98_9STRA|eukprot:CCRYP_002297-RA/>CCRYP_002297-RA protein AED:0.15 eAED:0.15 QI:0/-1/0/1/-1/1/1/0/394